MIRREEMFEDLVGADTSVCTAELPSLFFPLEGNHQIPQNIGGDRGMM